MHRTLCRSLPAGLALAFTWVGCAATDTEATEPGEIVFECSYVNFAWGHRHTGYYVDRDGGVHRYDRSGDPWESESLNRGDSRIPATDLHAKLENAELYRDVPAEMVAEKAALLARAATGEVTREHELYDAGTRGCVGYLYDHEKQTYRTVGLGGEGDYRTTNSAPEAPRLLEWLQGLAPPRRQESAD